VEERQRRKDRVAMTKRHPIGHEPAEFQEVAVALRAELGQPGRAGGVHEPGDVA
jgi:hypothetical protein